MPMPRNQETGGSNIHLIAPVFENFYVGQERGFATFNIHNSSHEHRIDYRKVKLFDLKKEKKKMMIEVYVQLKVQVLARTMHPMVWGSQRPT